MKNCFSDKSAWHDEIKLTENVQVIYNSKEIPGILNELFCKSSHTTQKFSKTATKLQYKPHKYIHSNTIAIPKFRHLLTCRNWVLGVTSFTPCDPIYGLNTFSVLGTGFEQNFVPISNVKIISFEMHSECLPN